MANIILQQQYPSFAIHYGEENRHWCDLLRICSEEAYRHVSHGWPPVRVIPPRYPAGKCVPIKAVENKQKEEPKADSSTARSNLSKESPNETI